MCLCLSQKLLQRSTSWHSTSQVGKNLPGIPDRIKLIVSSYSHTPMHLLQTTYMQEPTYMSLVMHKSCHAPPSPIAGIDIG
jgi:hypothetical protein